MAKAMSYPAMKAEAKRLDDLDREVVAKLDKIQAVMDDDDAEDTEKLDAIHSITCG